MAFRWEIKEKADEQKVKELSEQLNNLDFTLTNILIQRGIDTFEKAKDFFRPSLEQIHDPFLMKDMKNAVNRLNEAIENNEKVLIYGDYDVDGTTSVALVYSYLKNFYPHLEYYIPDRYTEGYGVSFQGIDYASENDFKLIISLDCGIKAIEKVAYASEKGIDFIICDHHRPGNEIPKAIAVLDPKREDCEYPYKELSGCGVGFKLMQAWTKNNEKDEQFLFQYLDLLAVSTCADIVPITGENRVFVYYGLKQINENPRLGIKTMIELAGLKKELTVMDVVFTIAPRINAAGRIESGRKAVEMLVEENNEKSKAFGGNINEMNTDRKDLDREITAEALRMIAENTALQNKKTTVLFQENWHKGVIGIVASRLIETHYRPTIILTESNGKATGSARSVSGFDVYNAIDACSDLLEQFGGHKYAAGLTLKLENLDAFIEKFEEVVTEQIEDHMLTPQINIDAELKLDQINDSFYKILKQFAPTGPGNMRPVFMSENVFCTANSRIVGENHLKIEVFQEENPDLKFSCIGFNFGDKLDELAEGVPFSMVYNIEENTWNGITNIQLNIKDLRV
ncbi:MAG: single-stranded-DNA-specific exonuclease RecJ [Flavobacteriales bacterium]|nr:single-stranded-DNA-specific exonuclease RecJ [Flavobacteriales bacterium]MCB9335652.1 single-stranded-DNA-specific exonuclease RecJ [Flavobacteriales bacterium]